MWRELPTPTTHSTLCSGLIYQAEEENELSLSPKPCICFGFRRSVGSCRGRKPQMVPQRILGQHHARTLCSHPWSNHGHTGFAQRRAAPGGNHTPELPQTKVSTSLGSSNPQSSPAIPNPQKLWNPKVIFKVCSNHTEDNNKDLFHLYLSHSESQSLCFI